MTDNESSCYYSKEIPPMEAGVILSTVSQDHADELAQCLWEAAYAVEPGEVQDES